MRKILLAAHGELSASFIKTLHLIAGDTQNVTCFCMTKLKSGEQARKEIKHFLETKKENEDCVILTDLFGGSVSNICINLLSEGEKFHLITGINLPMVLSIVLSEEEDIQDVVKNGIEESKNGIIHVNALLENIRGGEDNDFINEDR